MKTTETKTELLDAPVFENLNPVGENLDYIQAVSPAALRDELKKIRLPMKILSIYSYGSLHIAWIQTQAKIKRKGK